MGSLSALPHLLHGTQVLTAKCRGWRSRGDTHLPSGRSLWSVTRFPRVEGGPRGPVENQEGHPQTQTHDFRKNPSFSELPNSRSGGRWGRTQGCPSGKRVSPDGRGVGVRWYLRNGVVAAGKQREQLCLLSQQPPGPRMSASLVSATPVQPLGIV